MTLGVGHKTRGRILGAIAALALTLGLAPAASAYTPGTSPDFFGVNASFLRALAYPDQPNLVARMDASAASMGQAGISWARVTFDQSVEEHDKGVFNWTVPDMIVATLASHGVRTEPTFVGTAAWADAPGLLTGFNNCGNRAYPYDVSGWAGWVAAAAQRYGPSGTFWAAHPGLPQLPIRTWEIGNEPNTSIFWCPKADPEQYSQVYSASQNAITAVDPAATVIVGGLVPNFGTTRSSDVDAKEFLIRMVSANPSLATRIPEVGIHPSARTVDGVPDQLSFIAKFRQAMIAAGMPNTPMLANEFGWYTQPQSGDLWATESQRTALIGADANQFWRTNCGVSGMAPYSWITAEMNPNDPQNWFGLASTWTGVPHPSGAAYAQQIQLALGRASSPPPGDTIAVCPTATTPGPTPQPSPSPPPSPSPSPGLLPGVPNLLQANDSAAGQAASQPHCKKKAKKKKGKKRKRRRC